MNYHLWTTTCELPPVNYHLLTTTCALLHTPLLLEATGPPQVLPCIAITAKKWKYARKNQSDLPLAWQNWSCMLTRDEVASMYTTTVIMSAYGEEIFTVSMTQKLLKQIMIQMKPKWDLYTVTEGMQDILWDRVQPIEVVCYLYVFRSLFWMKISSKYKKNSWGRDTPPLYCLITKSF